MPNLLHEISARRKSGPERFFVPALFVVAFAFGVSGCVREASIEGELLYDYPVVSVDTVPGDIYAYPRAYYGDGYAYLVGDRWYYESPRGWMLFRVEPRELARQRVYIGSAPERGVYPRGQRPRYYEERRPRSRPQEPVERGRRYYPQ